MTTFNTLDFKKENLYIPGRRTGNTTRQVEAAVRAFLIGYNVEVRDHHDDGQNLTANLHLLRLITNELEKNYPAIRTRIRRSQKDKIEIERADNLHMIIKRK